MYNYRTRKFKTAICVKCGARMLMYTHNKKYCSSCVQRVQTINTENSKRYRIWDDKPSVVKCVICERKFRLSDLFCNTCKECQDKVDKITELNKSGEIDKIEKKYFRKIRDEEIKKSNLKHREYDRIDSETGQRWHVETRGTGFYSQCHR